MPIGQNDIAVNPPAYDATDLVDAMFQPVTRNFISRLIPLANQKSATEFAASYVVMPDAAPPAPAPAQSFVSLLNPPELDTMINAWWQIWTQAVDPTNARIGNPSDVAVLDVLRNYIGDPTWNGTGNPQPAGTAAIRPLVVWLPTIAYDGMADALIKLRLVGYRRLVLWANNWVEANVRELLKYLAFGAHFVAVSAARDYPLNAQRPQPFYTVFANQLANASRWARAHSHYGGLGPTTNVFAAYAYPSLVNAETTPDNAPYIVALLVGRTAWALLNDNWNTFIQLEGWPATGAIGIGINIFPPGLDTGRHGADYDTHNATLWNISTYGASLFSEKRGTTIFLSSVDWQPNPGGETIMAPYVGAETKQRWLQTKLIRFN